MERAEGLLALYEEMGVPRDRVLVRVPATWEGIQAAKALEAQGVATHLILVYRCAGLYGTQSNADLGCHKWLDFQMQFIRESPLCWLTRAANGRRILLHCHPWPVLDQRVTCMYIFSHVLDYIKYHVPTRLKNHFMPLRLMSACAAQLCAGTGRGAGGRQRHPAQHRAPARLVREASWLPARPQGPAHFTLCQSVLHPCIQWLHAAALGFSNGHAD